MNPITPSQLRDLPDLTTAEYAFLHHYPQFKNAALASLRQTEFSRLDANGQVYLDYTGGGLYAASQLRQHQNLLSENVFGNPHSQNPTSVAMTELVEQTRQYVLQFFNASPDEYELIFTPNASGALKLVGESYPFTPESHYLLTFDNHNSVLGMREFARSRGAKISYIPVLLPEMRADPASFRIALADCDLQANNLFSYPAQSNFSGVQHPLMWIAEAQKAGWDVLLDAAAFAPTNRLDLGVWHPDFVTLSFYKIFGYPTGIGALIAKRSALAKLQRPWFAGGTITIASVQGDGHYLAEGAAGFEDGTIDYLNIPAVEIGLRFIDSVGIEAIHTHTVALTGWLLSELQALKHDNGAPLVKLYGPQTLDERGGTITFNLFDAQGHLLDFRLLERLGSEAGISFRTGCFCNPGAGEVAHSLTAVQMRQFFREGGYMTYEQFTAVVQQQNEQTAGALRVSVSLPTNFADVYRFIYFLRQFCA